MEQNESPLRRPGIGLEQKENPIRGQGTGTVQFWISVGGRGKRIVQFENSVEGGEEEDRKWSCSARRASVAMEPKEDGHGVLTYRDSGRAILDKGAGNCHTKSMHKDNGEFPSLGSRESWTPDEVEVERQRPLLPLGGSGGAYSPPFKHAQLMRDVEEKGSNAYQRLTCDALRKSLNGLVNKVNGSNLKNISRGLFSENLIRGRGLFARSCMKAQMAYPAFTHVFAALVAVVNTKFPELGDLLLKRIILQWRRALKRNDRPVLLAAAKFIAHLVNHRVVHEIVFLELLTVLLENPADNSVEVAVGFVKECGSVLQEMLPQGFTYLKDSAVFCTRGR